MNLKWLALIICLLLGVATAVRAFPPGTESLLAGKTRSPIPPVSITSVGLSPTTFTTGGSGTVGTLSATPSSGSPTGTFALKNSGSDHSGTTCNNYSSYFSVSGSSLNFNSSAPAQSYPGTCITYTQAMASNSPYTQAFNVTGNSSGGLTAPGPAVAAGFTTLALNMDFTNQTQSSLNGVNFNAQDINHWLDCKGASPPMWYFIYPNYFNNSTCNDFRIEADPSNGLTVLHLQYTQTDFNNGSSNTEIQTCDGNDVSTGCSAAIFPQAKYVEIVWRTDSNTIHSMDAYTCCDANGNQRFFITSDPLWSWYLSDYGGTEWDFVEISNFHDVGSNAGLPNYNTIIGTDNQVNYHTYSVLQTSDGTNTAVCEYADGRGVGGGGTASCAQPNVGANGVHLLLTSLGPVRNGGSGNLPGAPANLPMNSWIQRIRIWDCAAWSTSRRCNTGLITSAP